MCVSVGGLGGPCCSGHKLSNSQRRGPSTQTKDSDLTKWAVNDGAAPHEAISTQTRGRGDEGGTRATLWSC